MKKSFFSLILLAAFGFRAGATVSEPDNVVYGAITLGGIQVLASDTNIFVAARFTANGPPIATYTMGFVSSVGNDYSLRIPTESVLPVTAADAAATGQVIYIDVDDQNGIRAQTTFTVGPPGTMTLLNFNGPNTGQTIFPADNNPTDGSVSISEVVAYTLSWREGAPWPIAPTSIPVSYAVRAGALWRGGGSYTINGSIGAAPAWWVNGSTVPTIPPANLDNATCSMPSTFLPGLPITVSETITPAPGVGCYAVEDQPPPGWTVANINDGGGWDAVNGKVKWGLFFDQSPRTLTYQLTPPTNASGSVTFNGQASFDGFVTLSISGQRSISYQPTPTFGLVRLGLNSNFHIGLKGSPGETFYIEASTNLLQWQTISTIVIDSTGSDDFYDPITNRTRFYHILLQP